MPPTPLISIIIPAYNAGPFIGETLDSILEQSYPHWEAIVVDDHSTDNTAAVVKSYRDPRIQYHLAPRHGGRPSINRNIGIGQAKGDFITFMDADDAYYPDGLKTLLEPLLENDRLNASMAFPYYCDNELKPLHPSTHLVENATGSFEFSPLYQLSWESICRREVHLFICPVMFRKRIMDVLFPLDEELLSGDDFKTLVSLFRYGFENVKVINTCTYKYRNYAGSITKRPERLMRTIAGHISLTNWLFSLPELPNSLTALKGYHLSHRLAIIASLLTKMGRTHLTLQVILSSLQHRSITPKIWVKVLGKEVVRAVLPPSFQDLCSKILRTNKVNYFGEGV